MEPTDCGLRIAAAATVLVLYLTHMISGPVAIILGVVAAVSSPVRRRLPGVHPTEDLDTEKKQAAQLG